MTKSVRNPDETPDIGALDPIRRLVGGETPAEQTRRAEQEQRDRPQRILDRLRRKKR